MYWIIYNWTIVESRITISDHSTMTCKRLCSLIGLNSKMETGYVRNIWIISITFHSYFGLYFLSDWKEKSIQLILVINITDNFIYKPRKYVYKNSSLTWWVTKGLTRKSSGALIMAISYEISCDICFNSIHKYIYSDQKNVKIVCLMSCCINLYFM
jgi:hypothetical protein